MGSFVTNGIYLSAMALLCGCAGISDKNYNNGKAALPERAVTADNSDQATDLFWRNANVYFMMTDRFANGNPDNDNAYGRVKDGDKLRSFLGGDIAGINQKLEEGYFSDLGINAIWTTPLVEQVHQPFEEYGRSYAFHGYWTRDWTNVDAAYGTEEEFARMVKLAHDRDIRIVVDVVMNHAGPPINDTDPRWPTEWVRTEPACDYESFAGTATCQIVPALQEIRTDSKQPVELPPHLVRKWKEEGRYETEMAELDAFFARTGYPRAPRYYLIKWLTDWVREYGVDGFRADTAKHIDPDAWAELKAEADIAFAEWKAKNPERVLDNSGFYMVGEVFNYGLDGFQKTVPGTREYDYGDIKVDFYDYGFDALINMGFATHAEKPVPELFQLYSDQLNGVFSGVGVLNYISSHDDQKPLDPDRENPFWNAAKLLLAPGGVQIYYGDELNRSLTIEGTTGDATLRSFMDWDATQTIEGKAIFAHWQRLANFRKNHPAIGAGIHREISRAPYVFTRSLNEGQVQDMVVVAMDKTPFSALNIAGAFPDGTEIKDAYSGETGTVVSGKISFNSPRTIVLLEVVAD